VLALREQNVQVAAGRIGQPPAPTGVAFQYTVNTLGRLLDPEQFGDIVVKTASTSHHAPATWAARARRATTPSTATSTTGPRWRWRLQRPGSNALATAESIERTMTELSKAS
jgi:multidrug efflux pump subunit AcrB